MNYFSFLDSNFRQQDTLELMIFLFDFKNYSLRIFINFIKMSVTNQFTKKTIQQPFLFLFPKLLRTNVNALSIYCFSFRNFVIIVVVN